MSRVAEIIRLQEQDEVSQWDQARLIWEELETGKTQRVLAEEIGKSCSHVAHMSKVWSAYHGKHEGSFAEAYAEVKRPKPKTNPEEKAAEAAETPQPDRSALEDINPPVESTEVKEDTREVHTTKGGNTYKKASKAMIDFDVYRERIIENIKKITQQAVELMDYPDEVAIVLTDIEELEAMLQSVKRTFLFATEEA